MSELDKMIQARLAALPTAQDIARGHFDVKATAQDGKEVTIRLNVPREDVGSQMIFRFHKDSQGLPVVKALAASEQIDSLLASLPPHELKWVINAALCLCAGKHFEPVLASMRGNFRRDQDQGRLN